MEPVARLDFHRSEQEAYGGAISKKMKQVIENLKTGAISVADVPPPILRPGTVLIRNHYSLISKGTEAGTVRLGKMGLIGKARARPEHARKVIDLALRQGPLTALSVANRALDVPIALGYCSSGIVEAVAPDVAEFAVGDQVACGGAGYANHAEVVCVPKNLCVKLPKDADLRHAVFTTIGAIAVQALRVSKAQLGERVVVIGLGLVGVLLTTLLRAAGCRVFGVDKDPMRLALGMDHGLEAGALVSSDTLQTDVQNFSTGQGADAVFVAAGTDDNGPVALAGQIARIKGRVVVVGRTEMDAPRETYLYKELELLTSMGYGPGTGDDQYELKGHDYPVGYVRWTENRNMDAFAHLAVTGAISVDELISHEFDIDEAPAAFDLITGAGNERCTAVILRYPVPTNGAPTLRPPDGQRVSLRRKLNSSKGPNIGVIGAGSYATNEFLPLLAKEKQVRLRGIASATGLRATALGTKYGFEYSAAEPHEVLDDSDTDCVFILTRHDSHAQLAADALRAGKHVFVEKPLALNRVELEQVRDAWNGSGCQLMVGFNRRFSKHARRLRDFFEPRSAPLSITYRANVGYRARDHWLHDDRQGGGVIIGEACHHIDFCNWLVGAAPETVTGISLGGNCGAVLADTAHISLQYKDGSIAAVQYVSNGAKSFADEAVEVHCAGRSAVLTDYKSVRYSNGSFLPRAPAFPSLDKGHAGQIRDFLLSLGEREPRDVDLYFSSSLAAIRASEICRPLGHPDGARQKDESA